MEDQALKKEREELVAKAIAAGQPEEVAEAMPIDDLRIGYGEPEKTKMKALADMSLEDLEGLSDKALKKLCKAEEMTTDGKKEDRFNRLYAKRFGLTKRYIGADTCCQFCGKRVLVKGTVKDPQGDGRVLITRSVKCVGKHHHTYPLSQFEGKK